MYFFQHDVTRAEALAVADAIMEGHLTTGVMQKRFADALRAEFDFGPVALCNSGTSALHLALVAAGVGPGDEVITTPYVGVWTVNPILMVGATPVFADIDRGTYNLDPAAVEAKVTDRTKAVMPVSVNGVPCDLQGLRRVLPDSVRIICDDIEALGSMRNGRYVGADVGNDVSVNGFWVSKQVTTCSGGMVTSQDEEFVDRCAKLARHGHGAIGDMWNQSFGYNYAFPDPLAAMGIAQLSRMWDKQANLLIVKDMLDAHFRQLRRQYIPAWCEVTEFVYLIELPEGVDKRTYADRMAGYGIPTRPYFNSLLEVPHLKPYASSCPVATEVSARTIALPYHWKITADDVEEIAEAHAVCIR